MSYKDDMKALESAIKRYSKARSYRLPDLPCADDYTEQGKAATRANVARRQICLLVRVWEIASYDMLRKHGLKPLHFR